MPCYRITSIGLPPQERRDIEQLLRVGLRAQPVTDRPLTLHGRLVERGVVAAGEGRSAAHNTHGRVRTRVAIAARSNLALPRRLRHAPRSSGPAEPRSHDRDAYLILELRVDDGAYDDGGIIGSKLFYDRSDFLELADRQVHPGRNVDQYAVGAGEVDILEQR